MKLAEARQYALSLPEAAEQPHFELTSFRVRGKIFATAPPGTQELRIFVDETERERAIALYPGFISKLFWGKKVSGLSVDLALAKPAVVKDLLLRAWTAKAPKGLAAGLTAATGK